MNYAWEKSLRDYQLTAAQWLSAPPFPFRGRLLADGLGLGKTRQALGAVRYRAERAELDAPPIIITTASARIDWGSELRAFWPEMTPCFPGGASASYQRAGESDEDFLARTEGPWRNAMLQGDTTKAIIVNIENLGLVKDFLVDHSLLNDSVIIDEAHNLKRESSQPSRLARAVCAASRCAMMLSATPIDNRPHEMFNLLDICGPGQFGTFFRFVNKFFLIAKSNWGTEIHDLLYPEKLRKEYAPVFMRRTAGEVFKDMPARIRHMHRVDAPNAVRISPAKIQVMKKGEKLDAMLRETVRYKLKAAADFIYNSISGPVVAYTYKKDDAEKFAKLLEDRGYSVVLSHGDVPVKRRMALIEEWKEGKFDIIVSTMDALRESATLVRAKNMVFVDLDWRFVKVLQCEGRIDPARQKDGERCPVAYHYFLTRNGPDEIVAEALLHKIRESQKLLNDPGAGSFGEFLGPLAAEMEELATLSETDLLSAFVARATSRAERFIDLGL